MSDYDDWLDDSILLDVDIEDIRLQIGSVVAVTFLCNVLWCESQAAFTYKYGKQKTTAMQRGIARHNELELQVHDIIPVKITIAEDAWAIRFLNVIATCQQIQTLGISREIPVFGFYDDRFILGVMDEMDRNGLIKDVKTRGSNRKVSDAQKRSGRFQVLMYAWMWNRMHGISVDEFIEWMKSISELNWLKCLSGQVEEIGKSVCYGKEVNLRNIVQVMLQTVQCLPLAESGVLVYEYKGEELERDAFFVDEPYVDATLDYVFSVFRRNASLNGVTDDEMWKCRHCNFRERCQWRKV